MKNKFTCSKPKHNNCVCCVIAPHMLDSISKNGDSEQRDWAIKTLCATNRLLGRREVMQGVPFDAPSITGQLRRTIFTASNSESLPGTIVRSEGSSASSDPAVDEAYDGAGETYQMYLDVFKRNSLDDKGLRLDSTVHYGKGYDNAFWDGRQMVYGDGDGHLFNRFTLSLDVIAHELTHGVVQKEANLVYWDQSGALNEHMADVFGILTKQRKHQLNVKQSDWLIGVGLLTDKVRGKALRSLKEPGTAYNDPVLGKDPQPAHMRRFVVTHEDNGGVHINSGIPNRAFYVACELLNDQWKPAQIWYVTLRDRLRERSTFKDCAQLTIAVAGELYGSNGKEQQAIKKCWDSVGIKVK